MVILFGALGRGMSALLAAQWIHHSILCPCLTTVLHVCPNIKNGTARDNAVLPVWNTQNVTVRLGAVKEEKVALTWVRAKIIVLPSPGAYMAFRLG